MNTDVPPATDATAAANTGDDAAGQAAVTGVSYFHGRLAPYGTWVASASYGEVWVPRMGSAWRPYRTGHWVYTDQGWAWIADESWGWATFHYGRWYFDPDYGWAWVPGTVWAPAWVAWRDGGGYLGWAPLPPTVGYVAGVGIDLAGVEISTAYWAFVPEAAILAPSLSVVIVAGGRNSVIYGGTRNITAYSEVNGRIVNQGIGVARIEQLSGHPVQRVPVGQLGFNRPAALAGAHAEFGRALPSQVAAERARGLVTGRPAARSVAAGHRMPAPLARATHGVRNAAGAITGHRPGGPSQTERRSAVPGHTQSAHPGAANQAARSAHSSTPPPHASAHPAQPGTGTHSTNRAGATTSSSTPPSHQRSTPPPHASPPPPKNGHKPPPGA